MPFDSNEKHPDAVFSLRIATSSKITLRRNSGATVVVATTSVTCAEGMNADAFWNSCDQLRNGSYSQTYNVIGSTTIFILVDALNADETGAFDIDIEVAPIR